MKKIVFLFLFLGSFILVIVNAQNGAQVTYTLESMDGSPDGYALIKVWNMGKKDKLTPQLAMYNAIHGILFKGIPGKSISSANKGYAPLCPDGYNAHKEYFDNFFASNEYLQYVELANNGNVVAGDRFKLSNGSYKIGMVCLINITYLRKRLEQDGIIRSFGSIF